MTTATSAEQIYAVIKNNGAIPFKQRPTEKQLRYYADLIIKTGGRFEISPYAKSQWTGITNWKLSKLIAYLENQTG